MSFSLGAIGGAVGGLIGPLITTAGQLYANKKNIQNQDFWNNVSLAQSNSAHQREIADLEKAGLNPILSAGGMGLSTPTLRAATVENPVSSFGSSSSTLSKVMSGQMAAEIEQAKSEASSAASVAETDRAYADRANELVSAELSTAHAQNDIAHSRAKVAEMQSYNDRIDELARTEALQGFRPGEVDVLIPKGKDGTYKKLVQQYKNEIASGEYKSSVGRAVFQDVLSGASSAADIYRTTRGANKGRTKRP